MMAGQSRTTFSERDNGIQAAFFLAASHKGIKDPFADRGVCYERDLVFSLMNEPSYLFMQQWPASTIVHARYIDDAPVERGVVGDNLLWFFGTKKEWLLDAYKKLGDDERNATAAVCDSIKRLFLDTNNEYLKASRHHIAKDVQLYAEILEIAHLLFNERVAQSLRRLEELHIEHQTANVSLDELFGKNLPDDS